MTRTTNKKKMQKKDQAFDFYNSMQDGFFWEVPKYFNIAAVCCRRWALCSKAANTTAIIAETPESLNTANFASFSYLDLSRKAQQLSHHLAQYGIGKGDCVAIVMPQCFDTAVAYMAVLQMGAIAMPLSTLFGPDALCFRLQDSETKIVLTDVVSMSDIESIQAQCPSLQHVWVTGGALDEDLSQYSEAFDPIPTLATDPAILIYTSGTTGNPKGALIPHQALIGNLSGFVCSQNWLGFDGGSRQKSKAVFWSPADWAWTGGLLDALLPTLYFGLKIVAFNGRFSPENAFNLMQKHQVSHSFLFPTALKAMMKAFPKPRQQFKLKLQAVMSAGEAVGDAVFHYCQQQLGITVNEMFGQTEVNYIVGNCAMNGQPSKGRGWPAKAGSMGKAYPGHWVEVINENGDICAPYEIGDVSIHRFNQKGQLDPIFFLGYWKNLAATEAKFTRDWCRTGDLAYADEQGYLWYQGRVDDVFKAAGYRIGPSEVENCLVKHPAVVNAAVVPKPDPDRGALVKAYVVLAAHTLADPQATDQEKKDHYLEIERQLQLHVKGLLAPYEYPKEIEFVDSLPMTTTGKVQRRILRLQEQERALKASQRN